MEIHFMQLKQFFKAHFVFIKFAVSSLFSTAIDLAIFTLFIYFLEKPFPDTYIIIATTIARAISSIINYTLNKKIVFQEEEQIHVSVNQYVLICIIQLILSV